MLKKLTAGLTLASFLFSTGLCGTAAAVTKAEKEAKLLVKVKERVAKMGVGEKAIIRVEFKGQKKALRGYVGAVGEEEFSVVDPKKGTTTNVAYRDVDWVTGKSLPTAAKIGIAAGAVLGGIIIIMLYFEASD